ncbi:hypothetical protein [Marinobacterium jannaschii]|nr:hypothetical protein [Marinobacterium jannaschii]
MKKILLGLILALSLTSPVLAGCNDSTTAQNGDVIRQNIDNVFNPYKG